MEFFLLNYIAITVFDRTDNRNRAPISARRLDELCADRIIGIFAHHGAIGLAFFPLAINGRYLISWVDTVELTDELV